MARITPYFSDGNLGLDIDGDRVPVTVLDDRIDARLKEDVISVRLASKKVNAKLAAFFNEDIRLVYMDDTSQRAVDPDLGEGGVNLADNSPISIINTASLKALSDTVGYTIEIEQFRPNLVIHSDVPWAEDGWRTLKIGTAVFDLVRPISRCKVITLKPKTGQLIGPEIMKSLVHIRKSGDARVKGVLFGWAAIPRNCAEIDVGSDVTLSKSGEPWPIA